ncbi:hypothetical protein V8D89_009353 [Ganoderma adspersum]
MSTFVQLFYGPLLLGIMLNILLYGVMITQTYLYFSMYRDDRLWLKIFVLVLFFCDTVNTALDIAAIYVPLINRFGDFEALTMSTWMFASDSVTTVRSPLHGPTYILPPSPKPTFIQAVVAALVQFFFAWRLKVLITNNWIVAIVLVCAVIQLLGGIGCTITLVLDPSFADVRRYRFIGIIWNVSAALADVIIAAALVWHLWKHKTGVSATDNMINKIIRLTVQTGFVTALFAVMTLILYFVLTSGYDLLFHMPLAKLYTNSLMSTLNSRRMWMSDFCESDSMSFGAATGSMQRSRSRANVNVDVNVVRSERGGRTRGPERIVIGVESHQMTDLSSDGKDSDNHSTRSFIPQEKPRGMSATEAAV